MQDWDEQLYREIMESILHYLDTRRRGDTDFDRKALKELLETEYRKQDLGWAGKSPVEQIKDAATIAALEQFLSQW